MKVKIYKPAKTTMQSGRAKTADWVLEGELETPRTPDPVMGWTSAGDTLNQLRMTFENKDAAIAFAQSKGWEYSLDLPKERKIKPRNYIDNFKYRPVEEEAG